jgi:hypothetical protein
MWAKAMTSVWVRDSRVVGAGRRAGGGRAVTVSHRLGDCGSQAGLGVIAAHPCCRKGSVCWARTDPLVRLPLCCGAVCCGAV